MNKIVLATILFFLFACEENTSNRNKTNDFRKTKSRNYEFLQSKNKQKARETLIVVIDPHGNGKLAVSEFKEIAEIFDCTVIGLNDVENNVSDFERKIENDVNSAKNDLNLDVKQFYVAGFSGGARMAFQYALSHKVDGVLMCGAGINLQKVSKLSFPLVMITGTKDFNFIEQYYSPYSPVVRNKNVLTLFFEGKHEWSPKSYILNAMLFLFGKNGKISDKYVSDLKTQSDEYLKNKDFFKAFKSYEACYKTCNNKESEAAELALNDLLKNELFRNFVNRYELSLQKEIDRNNKYIKFLNDKDLDYWYNEIMKINKSAKSKDVFEAESYSRTKAYLGVAMYSFVNREITNPWSKVSDKYLKIYEMLEPENPDMWFFNAVRQKQKNNSALSEKYLKRAFVLGFKDSLKAKKYDLIH